MKKCTICFFAFTSLWYSYCCITFSSTSIERTHISRTGNTLIAQYLAEYCFIPLSEQLLQSASIFSQLTKGIFKVIKFNIVPLSWIQNLF